MGRPATALDREGPALCLCLSQARTADIVLIAAAGGVDAVYVDLEHGVTPLDVASMLCTTALGAGVLPLVRVPPGDAATITRALDGGALGVIVPHVDTPERARAAVEACRFPPLGRRTPYGATPVTGYVARPVPDLVQYLDGDVLVVAMIESAVAVGNAPGIAAIAGVDVLLVGAHDLSVDLGVPGETGHAAVLRAIDDVAGACDAAGRRWGVAGIGDEVVLKDLVARGVDLISIGSDAGLLQQAAAARVTALRRLPAPGKDRTR